jgi:hypothetical protein
MNREEFVVKKWLVAAVILTGLFLSLGNPPRSADAVALDAMVTEQVNKAAQKQEGRLKK